MSRHTLAALFAADDLEGLVAAARERPLRTLGFIASRLLIDEAGVKERGLGALESVVAADAVSVEQLREQLRRFVWALNDESGAVPFGVPEAMAVVLAARPELQGEFLPLLASLLTEECMSQTGAIERGAAWALGRVGPPVAACAPDAVEALTAMAERHPDPQTRGVAAAALARVRAG